MREPVYRKIVFWISNQRTWIDVVDADMYGVFAFLYRGTHVISHLVFCCSGLINPIMNCRWYYLDCIGICFGQGFG